MFEFHTSNLLAPSEGGECPYPIDHSGDDTLSRIPREHVIPPSHDIHRLSLPYYNVNPSVTKILKISFESPKGKN